MKKLMIFLLLHVTCVCSYAEIHPIIFVGDSTFYQNVYFDMDFDAFKNKFNSVAICTAANNSNLFESICTFNFKFAGFESTRGIVAFSDNKLIGAMAYISDIKYNYINSSISLILNDEPRIIRKKEFVNGLNNNEVENTLTSWIYSNYVLVAGRFNPQLYVEGGENYSIYTESASPKMISKLVPSAELAMLGKAKINLEWQPISTVTVSVEQVTSEPTPIALEPKINNSTSVVPTIPYKDSNIPVAMDLNDAKSRKLEKANAIIIAAQSKEYEAAIYSNMTGKEFCEAFGKVLREEGVADILSFPELKKLVKLEAKKRKLSIDDSKVVGEKIGIGLSECHLYAAWGIPSEQNKSVGSWGVHIQHVYYKSYVYTENGRITSWQN